MEINNFRPGKRSEKTISQLMHKVIHILWIKLPKEYFSIIHNSYLLVDNFFYTIGIRKKKEGRRMENQKEKVEIWQQVLDIIEQNTTQISFETWFKPLRIRKIDRDLNIVYLELKSDKGKDFIIDTIKKRYMQYLQSAGVQHLLHLKSKSKILRPIEIMGFFYEFFCQIQENNLL